tara:strand:- start:2285 stop:3091 length:807 start_codon:yes stop_codon:yes gene_type:complete
MKKNKLDTNIKEKFGQRKIAPSANAWERLSLQLDLQPKQKKKGWFWFASSAASVLILFSLGLYTFSSDSLENIPTKEIIVNQEIDTVQILNKIEAIFKDAPVENALVKSEKKENRTKMNSKVIAVKKINIILPKKVVIQNIISKNNETTAVANVNKKNTFILPIKEVSKGEDFTNGNSRIKVNASDLLYAVLNEPIVEEEALKNNMSSAALLKMIKIELKKSNLKVDPKIILAEVESTIKNDIFQNNFLKSLKARITDIATAVASRND